MKTLLLPVAGKSARYPGMRPKWLLTMPNGKLMIEQSVSRIDCEKFDKVYVIALKEHIDKYVNKKILIKSLKNNISKKVELFILKKDTSCQAETILKFLQSKKIISSFLIKDCDTFFNFTNYSDSFSCYSNITDIDNGYNVNFLKYKKKEIIHYMNSDNEEVWESYGMGKFL